MAKTPKSVPIAMVSNTTLDLPEHREQVRSACEARGMLPKMMERLPARDEDPLAVSLGLVEEADVYLGIFAYRYGHVPEGHDRSISEMEYERAVERGIPCLVFLMGDNHAVRPGDVETGDGAVKLEALKARLRDRHAVKFFSSPDDLRACVTDGLAELDIPKPAVEVSGGHEPRLKPRREPDFPERPYPSLGPQTHPDLFAGRDEDLEEIRTLLSDPAPILCLFSVSGAGKSSLLRAGLEPRLSREGFAVSYQEFPRDQRLAARLLGSLLDWDGGAPFVDPDLEAFKDALRRVHRSRGKPAVLILDQFEDLMEEDAVDRARRLSELLTGTVAEDPSLGGPICRWILSYRHERHGHVEQWLQDSFRQAGLTWRARARCQTYPLKPLGEAAPEPLFLEVIRKPLQVHPPGQLPGYGVEFADGGAERLARAFANERKAQPRAPLVPELQVVLDHLLREAGWKRGLTARIQVPPYPQQLISSALADHLRRALEDTIPETEAGCRERRAEVLFVLEGLATKDGKRSEGKPPGELEAALGSNGPQVLRTLSVEHRLLHQESSGDAYVLSHDRLAEAVVAQAEEVREERRRQRLKQTDWVRWAAAAAVLVLGVSLAVAGWYNFREAGIALRTAESIGGSPEVALQALAALTEAEAAETLSKRERPWEVFEVGPAGIGSEVRAEIVASGVERSRAFLASRIRDGWKDEASPDLREVGSALWALDHFPMRSSDPNLVARARRIRNGIVEDLRTARPPSEEIAGLKEIPGGVFTMGSRGFAADESPPHDVRIDEFRMLDHEVTNQEFSGFLPEWEGRPAREPATEMSWYEAYAYAAWLGGAEEGRLPTEAEWEYAARAGDDTQLPENLREIAWFDENSGSRVHEVCTRDPNRWELCDMLGNVWEWTADWYDPEYFGTMEKGISRNPWGPPADGDRVIRGGSFADPPDGARASYRDWNDPGIGVDDLGFRVVVPAPRNP